MNNATKTVDVLVHFELNGSGTVNVVGSKEKPTKFTNLKLDFKRAIRKNLAANGVTLKHKSGVTFANGNGDEKSAPKKGAAKSEKKAPAKVEAKAPVKEKRARKAKK